jgi:hypothetical protein
LGWTILRRCKRLAVPGRRRTRGWAARSLAAITVTRRMIFMGRMSKVHTRKGNSTKQTQDNGNKEDNEDKRRGRDNRVCTGGREAMLGAERRRRAGSKCRGQVPRTGLQPRRTPLLLRTLPGTGRRMPGPMPRTLPHRHPPRLHARPGGRGAG